MTRHHPAWLGPLLAGLPLMPACGVERGPVQRSSALRAECIDTRQTLDASVWVCPEELRVECAAGDGLQPVDVIYFVAQTQRDVSSCEAIDLDVSDPGPYPVGVHEVDIIAAVPAQSSTDAAPSEESSTTVCSSQLTVVDTEPPVLEPREPILWPPNHKLQSISVDDCMQVSDACDDSTLEVVFTYARSDEPADAMGDGNHQPDIVWDGCDSVQLRAERQGGGDGRVYTLGVRARDAAGNVSEASCQVLVPHDQGGGSVGDSGIAFEMPVDGACLDDL